MSILIVIMIAICCYQYIKIQNLKTELDIRNTENKSLKIVLAENDLIPEKFVK